MITDKDKREIKDLIDETIEAQRKNRNAAYLWSFLVGCIGAGIFFIGTLILFGSHFSGIAGLATGFIYAVVEGFCAELFQILFRRKKNAY